MSVLRYVIRERENPTYLNTVVAVRVPQQLLQTSTVEQLLDEHLACAVLSNTNALGQKQFQHGHGRTIGSRKPSL
jgi:hypothetical protein